MRTRTMVPYLYIIPAFLMVAVFMYLPIIQNFYYSFFQMAAFSENIKFIGIDNFKRLFADKVFYIGLKNNFLFALICVFCQVGIGLVIAICLESKLTGKTRTFFRTVYFIPSVISVTAVGMLWQFIYEPNVGLLNTFLNFIGLSNLTHPWLGDSKTAIYSIIAMSQWQYTGYAMMLLIVAIQKVPDELYESAEIDGANGFQRAVYITVPQIKEMIVVTTVITVIGCFKVFTEVFTMTVGGPGNSSQVLGVYLYQNAFLYDTMGYASAIGVVVFMITFVFSIIQIKISRSGED